MGTSGLELGAPDRPRGYGAPVGVTEVRSESRGFEASSTRRPSGIASGDLYSAECYSHIVTESGEVLRGVMLETGTTQSDLARVSGVRQPTISQILTGRVGVSDEQLHRLLSCMGYDLEVVRRPVRPSLNRSEMRSWRLHRNISRRLTSDSLREWTPTLRSNLQRLGVGVRGEPHISNLGKWSRLIDEDDVPRLHRVLTGLDRHSIEMREVSPFGGILTQEERQQALLEAN